MTPKIFLSRPFIILLFVLTGFSGWTQNSSDQIIEIAKSELSREMEAFKSVQPSPYYIDYQITDMHRATVSSSFGSLTGTDQNHGRIFKVTVRVGDYSYDNTHKEENAAGMYGDGFNGAYASIGQLPLGNDARPIRHLLWEKTQVAYQQSKLAYQALKNKDTAISAKNDFSKEDPQVFIDAPLPEFTSSFQRSIWENRVKQLTIAFQNKPSIIEGSARLVVSQERQYFISSEGTAIAQNQFSAHLFVYAAVRTSDGDVAPLNISYFAFKADELPSQETMLKDVDEMVRKLGLLHSAPRAEPYTGPAILYSRAAAVFFHEIFGHRIEGHRLNSVGDAQTFKGMLNTKVLPTTLSVVSDPTLAKFNSVDLNGYYQFDNEGIKSRKVTVVDKGTLTTFLMSRAPLPAIAKSNGHGRASMGGIPVSRQSNLIVVNHKPVDMKDLRKQLINECKKQNKEYGYLFMDVTGGFTMTDRYMPNAFNIFPTEVYKVYVNGRPDELVHGVNLIGTPLSVFAEIAAADDKSGIFTGFCGAESGSIPVTAISPSIFVKRIETQKKIQTEIQQALLPPPSDSRQP